MFLFLLLLNKSALAFDNPPTGEPFNFQVYFRENGVTSYRLFYSNNNCALYNYSTSQTTVISSDFESCFSYVVSPVVDYQVHAGLTLFLSRSSLMVITIFILHIIYVSIPTKSF